MKAGPGPVNRIFGRTLVSTTLGIYTPQHADAFPLYRALCIYHQAERNSEGGYIMRRVHCAVNFETTFGKRVSQASTGTRGRRTVT